MTTETVLPTCEAEERRVLGAILEGNPAAYDLAAQQGITSADFFLQSHRLIYSALSDMSESGEGIDVLTVAGILRDRGHLAQLGGEAYLADLLSGVVFEPRNFASCVKRVRNAADLRKIVSACQATIGQAGDNGAKASECAELLNENLVAIQMGTSEVPTERIATPEDYPAWQKLSDCGQSLPGLTTGLSCLDSATTGIRAREFWILGGRTGDGKTSLMLQIAAANCEDGVPVLIFSMEMSRPELLHRLWAQKSSVPFWRIRNSVTSSREERDSLRKVSSDIERWPLWVNDSSSLTIQKLCSLARIAIRQHQIKLICVDYVQLISCPAREERERITKVSNALRALAKTTGVPVLAVSQLSRPRDGNQNARPNRFSLKESGSLENDAHVIVLTYRPTSNYDDQPTGEDQLIVAKQRHGAVGSETVHFKPEALKFFERTRAERK
ncbi:MAG TPA: DnaB-like helicase C-terminal domain-containing protein [Candidatus Sulfotelmatobacter sp.]|nr:DnaB-like helicase C-terminal domain-containing protein [Candidatus Sulfotelmatobacter sp.]